MYILSAWMDSNHRRFVYQTNPLTKLRYTPKKVLSVGFEPTFSTSKLRFSNLSGSVGMTACTRWDSNPYFHYPITFPNFAGLVEYLCIFIRCVRRFELPTTGFTNQNSDLSVLTTELHTQHPGEDSNLWPSLLESAILPTELPGWILCTNTRVRTQPPRFGVPAILLWKLFV